MDREHDEILFFQQCRTLDGRIQRIEVGRRNGRATPLFTPDWALIDPVSASAEAERRARAIRKELSINLNRLERRTWNRLVNERSILEIAREEGVSRCAIYERIRGNSKGQGGMIAKNPYVALWWIERLRRQKRP